MKTSQKGFIGTLLLIIIALVLVGGGTYVYMQTKQASWPAIGNVTLSQATSSMQATDSQTIDWRAYTDNVIGFKFQYPSTWAAPRTYGNYTDNEPYTVSTDGPINFSVSTTTTIGTFTQDKKENVVVGGQKGVKIYIPNEPGDMGPGAKAIFIQLSDRVIGINYTDTESGSEMDSIVEQIIKTIVFTRN